MSARRGWAQPLVPLYAAGLKLKEVLRGEPKRLQWPVVSVGSLSAGGAGKTPVVIALAGLLKDAGWGVDVLSRGYGRDGRGVGRVDVEAVDAARRFGDEPVLIAEKARLAVWVGAKRFEAGMAAEAQAALTDTPQRLKPAKMDGVDGTAEAVPLRGGSDGTAGAVPLREVGDGTAGAVPLREGGDATAGAVPLRGSGGVVAECVPLGEGGDVSLGGSRQQVHLLDDGFQHRGLARAVDVVLVTVEDLDDALIPAGNLREPLLALGRADVVVVREDEVEDVAKRVWPLLREGAQMWVVRRRLQFPAPLFVFGAGLRPVAFCGLARPEGFAAMLADAGCGLVETVAFRDHHRYTMADIERVIKVAKGLNATGFVTTEKDAVKLSAAMRARMDEVGPLMVVALEAEFDDPAAVVRALEARLARAGESPTQISYVKDKNRSSGGSL